VQFHQFATQTEIDILLDPSLLDFIIKAAYKLKQGILKYARFEIIRNRKHYMCNTKPG
tara:strand:+ start:296 stop:469 length:174 start_codon:yes stop_codon:yes gene_type:complete